jgi:hypothetical protein
MKIILLVFISTLFFSFFQSIPSHKGLGKIHVVKAYSQNILGKNIGYYVEFKNNGPDDVDALKWKAIFYDNFADFKGEVTGNWSSGNFISPMKQGESIKDLESAWIKDASKVVIKITKVHFTKGKTIGK